jgi:LysM repeat protein
MSLHHRQQRDVTNDNTMQGETSSATIFNHNQAARFRHNSPHNLNPTKSTTQRYRTPDEDLTYSVPLNRDHDFVFNNNPSESSTMESLKRGWMSLRDMTSGMFQSDSRDRWHSAVQDQDQNGCVVPNRRGNRAPISDVTSIASVSGFASSDTHKRKLSDSNADYDCNLAQAESPVDQLVYIHHVAVGDTYAGLALRYRCHVDDIQRANGLWSRDDIHVRKWLAIPCNVCETKATPHLDPNPPVQPHAPEPLTGGFYDPSATNICSASHDITKIPITTKSTVTQQHSTAHDDRPWIHDRWVKLPSFPQPVEMARVPRQNLGYFPRRRRKDNRFGAIDPSEPQLCAASNPSLEDIRELLDPDQPRIESININSSPPSLPIPISNGEVTYPAGSEARPAWMRRPGGVGTLSRDVRTPGPDTDYLNTWAHKHLPALSLDTHSSASESVVKGKDRLHPHSTTHLLPNATGPNDHVTSIVGLERAATAVETWIRGAFTNLRVGAPVVRPHQSSTAHQDLIELIDTGISGETVTSTAVRGSLASGEQVSGRSANSRPKEE